MTTEAKSPSRTRRWTLNFVTTTFAIALALLYVLVLRSISVQIAPPPGPLSEPYPDTSTQELCEEAGGRWISPVRDPVSERPAVPPDAGLVSNGVETRSPTPYCQSPLAFEREREMQQEKSQQTMLFVFAIGGAIVVAASLLVDLLKPVAPGLMLGGIVSFFIAGIQIWVLAPGWGRLVTIVAIFLILVGVGLYTLRKEEDKSSTR
ncbi:MAG: hypothetical protein AAB538_06270 [Patescibacteria group bacterium]